jgi:GTP-binding protein HflX
VRRIAIPGGHAVLADTVGFVRDLPHELVAAFRSTLSEAREADLLLHVVDAADPLRDERMAQVDAVLAEIGAGDIPQLLVFNKIDRIEGMVSRHDHPGAPIDGDAVLAGVRERVWLSARDGDGLALLRDALGTRLGLRRIHAELQLPASSGRLRARLHALGAVRGECHDERGWTLRLDLAEADALRLAAQADGDLLQALLAQVPDEVPAPDGHGLPDRAGQPGPVG